MSPGSLLNRRGYPRTAGSDRLCGIRPIAPNDSEENRVKNRRVDIHTSFRWIQRGNCVGAKPLRRRRKEKNGRRKREKKKFKFNQVFTTIIVVLAVFFCRSFAATIFFIKVVLPQKNEYSMLSEANQVKYMVPLGRRSHRQPG